MSLDCKDPGLSVSLRAGCVGPQVDALLTKLSQFTKEEDQQRVLTKIAIRSVLDVHLWCTPLFFFFSTCTNL